MFSRSVLGRRFRYLYFDWHRFRQFLSWFRRWDAFQLIWSIWQKHGKGSTGTFYGDESLQLQTLASLERTWSWVNCTIQTFDVGWAIHFLRVSPVLSWTQNQMLLINFANTSSGNGPGWIVTSSVIENEGMFTRSRKIDLGFFYLGTKFPRRQPRENRTFKPINN